MSSHLFIFGLGYSAGSIAKHAFHKGFLVSGTARDQAKCDKLKEQGIGAIAFDTLKPSHLEGVTHILSSIPPQEVGDIVLPLIQNFKGWLGYLSTTGVYGDYGGAWVDESSELRPYSQRLQKRVQAEEEWLAKGAHVFRLAGIYGPGRNALIDVLAGEARRIDKSGQVFSRIHVEDIAQVVVASMLRSSSEAIAQRIFNVCDDEPAPAHEVVSYACELLNVAPPPLVPFEQAELSPMGKEFYAANRRVSNRRIKDALGISLYYPTYREGLQALARDLQNR